MTNQNHVPLLHERVHYTGDMANAESWGTVVAVSDSRWGQSLTIRTDEQVSRFGPESSLAAREFIISPASFSPGSGRRFWRFADYWQDRIERLSSLYGVSEEETRQNLRKAMDETREAPVSPEPVCPICGKLAWDGDTDDDNQHPECVASVTEA